MDIQNEPVVVTATPTGFTAKLLGSIHTNTAWVEGEFKTMIAARPQAVDLDLSQTTFLSSMGIGLLVWLHNEVKKAGGSFRIVSIRKRVLATLKFSHLDGMLCATSATVVPD
jgi:anti-anti-sigma factor